LGEEIELTKCFVSLLMYSNSMGLQSVQVLKHKLSSLLVDIVSTIVMKLKINGNLLV